MATVLLDTCVLLAGLRSRQGASFKLLTLVGAGRFEIDLSVSLVLEYEEVLLREAPALGLTTQDVGDFVDYLCRIGRKHSVFFLWRPALRDPDDDMLLELAMAARSDFIVTHNVKDFGAAASMNVRIITPREFLQYLGDAP